MRVSTSPCVIKAERLPNFVLSQLITTGAYGSLPFFTVSSMRLSRRARSFVLRSPFRYREFFMSTRRCSLRIRRAPMSGPFPIGNALILQKKKNSKGWRE